MKGEAIADAEVNATIKPKGAGISFGEEPDEVKEFEVKEEGKVASSKFAFTDRKEPVRKS